MSKRRYAHVALATVAITNTVAPVATTVSYADSYSNETINSNSGSKYENETLKKFENGEYETKWLKGVQAPEPNQFTWFKDGFQEYMAVSHKYGDNWFDANKRFDGIDNILCSGAASANMLHWWLNMNKDNVERYLKMNDKHGVVNLEGNGVIVPETRETKKSFDLRDLIKVGFDKERHKSSIFDLYRLYFPRKGIWTSSTNGLFINGFSNKSIYTDVNQWNEYRSEGKGVVDKRGGYLADVFEGNQISHFNYINSYDEFNNKIKYALDNDQAIGMVYKSTYRMGHIINVWGADYDKSGNVVAVYVTDSDDINTKYRDKISGKNELVAMKRYRIVNKNGEARINNVYDSDSNGAKINNIHTLSLGTEYWNNYFRENGHNE